jgi:hypothetical protein
VNDENAADGYDPQWTPTNATFTTDDENTDTPEVVVPKNEL